MALPGHLEPNLSGTWGNGICLGGAGQSAHKSELQDICHFFIRHAQSPGKLLLQICHRCLATLGQDACTTAPQELHTSGFARSTSNSLCFCTPACYGAAMREYLPVYLGSNLQQLEEECRCGSGGTPSCPCNIHFSDHFNLHQFAHAELMPLGWSICYSRRLLPVNSPGLAQQHCLLLAGRMPVSC